METLLQWIKRQAINKQVERILFEKEFLEFGFIFLIFHCILEMSLLIIKLQISTLTHTLIKLYVLYIQKSRLVLSIAIDYFKSADRANFLHGGPSFLTSPPQGPCISSMVRLLWTCYYLKSRRFELVKMLKAVGLASTRFHIKFIPSE